MPLTEADQKRVDEAEAEAEAAGSSRLLVRSPPDDQKLGSITVMCLILNRTIGSGIYVTPALVLRATNSVGASLFLWTLGAIFGICGLLVWLELGLSIPKFQTPERAAGSHNDGEGVFESVPRNGGEKNYLEYIYKDPRFRTTCMYGFVFVILGNLAGNAVALGIYVMQAAGAPDHPHAIRGLAVAALTAACIIHGAWRRGGILLNNFLALVKVLTLMAVILIGFAAAGGASFGNGSVGKNTIKSNFDVYKSFSNASNDVSGFARSLIYIVYSYSGFKQPFYLSAIPKSRILSADLDMATTFFQDVFVNETAPRVMSGIIAFSIFGNIVVMTFTASRVKQEIAKEGILFSHFFARSTDTPYAWFRQRFWPSNTRIMEQSPVTALFLHWIFAVVLVGATSSTKPTVAYVVLVLLYAYTLVVMIGFFVAGGVLLLRITKRREWTDNLGFRPWGGPTAAIIYCMSCVFMLVGAFLTPSPLSPFSYANSGVRHYIVPAVGLSTLLMGYAYYLLFAKLIPQWRKKNLIVEREPIIVRQNGEPHGEWVQILEVVEFWWAARQGNGGKEV
ncbi:MAG: hypothetical protein Q9214_000595 [Letrouitia sp. 1 TL-2023]